MNKKNRYKKLIKNNDIKDTNDGTQIKKNRYKKYKIQEGYFG